MVNGANIYRMLNKAMESYEAGKYEAFGVYLGKASYIILEGHNGKHDHHHGKNKDDKVLYFDKLGADFLSGFFFGAKVGAFSEADMFECMKNSPADESIFEKADRELKRAMRKKDYQIGLDGMYDMVVFVTDLVNQEGANNTPICPELSDDTKASYDYLNTIVNEMSD